MSAELYRASGTPNGVVLSSTDVTRTIALAYKTRTALRDTDLAGLKFTRSPTQPNELWILHTQPPAPQPTQDELAP